MTLDEMIKHVEEVAEEQHRLVYMHDPLKVCEKSATEHRQLANWLKDYKRLLEREEDKWYSADERLPEYTDYYLVTVGINEYGLGMIDSIRTALFDCRSKKFTIHTGERINIVGKVKAWRELPELYKGVSA